MGNASERYSIVGNASERYSIVGNASERYSIVGRSALPLGSSKNASKRYSTVTNQSADCHARKRDPLPPSTATDQSADCHARRRDPLPDPYRSDTIRFNEQYLRDHYDLRYNTMLKTTEFRPKSATHLGTRSSSPAPGSAVVPPALETSQADNKDTPTAVLRARTTAPPVTELLPSVSGSSTNLSTNWRTVATGALSSK